MTMRGPPLFSVLFSFINDDVQEVLHLVIAAEHNMGAFVVGAELHQAGIFEINSEASKTVCQLTCFFL